jgi:hypothetical protein
VRLQLQFFITSALDWGWMVGWLRPQAGRLFPGKEVRYPLYGRLLGPRDRYGQLWVRISNRPPSYESLHRQHYRVRQTYVCQFNYKKLCGSEATLLQICKQIWQLELKKTLDVCFC